MAPTSMSITDFMTSSKSLARFASILVAVAATVLGFGSCVKVNEELGSDYLATNLQYDVYTTSFPLDDIVMDVPDSLSSYSLYRFTIGAIRDETFGLTTRSAAFTLVPVLDTLDFGTEGTQEFHSFHFAAVFDSVSCATADQKFIIQNVNVYELQDSIQYSQVYPELKIGTTRITDGIPVYNGSDTLSFNFSQEFGEKYMTVTQEELDTLVEYHKRFPGIYITMDEPAGYGGRINMFKVPIDVQYNSSYYYSSVCGSIATLSFSAEYDDRGVVDTSFMYYLGPLEKYDFDDVTYTSVSDYPQVAYNIATHESEDLIGDATDVMYLEGGRGIKPVVKAASLREKIVAEIMDKMGDDGDPSLAIISKATITMPFDFPDDYTVVDYQFPSYMSPTCRIVTDTSITFASITDVSVDDEDQGDLNRSLCNYAPDVTHHAQQLLLLDEDEEDISNYDIWFLPMADEEVEDSSTSSSSTSDLSDYYQYLMYSSYYNSMYGGYSSGSDYYSNYYNYYLYYSLYSSLSTSTTTTEAMIDFHRYYCLPLHGPTHEDGPTFTITYAIPKED